MKPHPFLPRILAFAVLIFSPAILASEISPRWEVAAGAGLTELRSGPFFRVHTRSFHATASVRPLRWLGVELGYVRVSEGVDSSLDLPPERWFLASMPHITRVKSEALRLGTALIWHPIRRLELSAKAMASYQVVSTLTYGGFVSPPPAWVESRDVRFVPAVGIKLSLTQRVWVGVEYETERLRRIDSRTWKANLSVRW